MWKSSLTSDSYDKTSKYEDSSSQSSINTLTPTNASTNGFDQSTKSSKTEDSSSQSSIDTLTPTNASTNGLDQSTKSSKTVVSSNASTTGLDQSTGFLSSESEEEEMFDSVESVPEADASSEKSFESVHGPSADVFSSIPLSRPFSSSSEIPQQKREKPEANKSRKQYKEKPEVKMSRREKPALPPKSDNQDKINNQFKKIRQDVQENRKVSKENGAILRDLQDKTENQFKKIRKVTQDNLKISKDNGVILRELKEETGQVIRELRNELTTIRQEKLEMLKHITTIANDKSKENSTVKKDRREKIITQTNVEKHKKNDKIKEDNKEEDEQLEKSVKFNNDAKKDETNKKSGENVRSTKKDKKFREQKNAKISKSQEMGLLLSQPNIVKELNVDKKTRPVHVHVDKMIVKKMSEDNKHYDDDDVDDSKIRCCCF